MTKAALNPQQKLFCRYYTQNTELYGNATLAYAEAYEFNLYKLSKIRDKDDKGTEIIGTSEYEKAYDSCNASAARLLVNVSIQKYITRCLNQLFKNEVIDRELTKVVLQDGDLPSKVAAIREFNKLKQRITEKSEIKVKLPTPIYGGRSTK